jgi:hypothetical protein
MLKTKLNENKRNNGNILKKKIKCALKTFSNYFTEILKIQLILFIYY